MHIYIYLDIKNNIIKVIFFFVLNTIESIFIGYKIKLKNKRNSTNIRSKCYHILKIDCGPRNQTRMSSEEYLEFGIMYVRI